MKREDMVGVYRQLGEEVVDAAGKVDPFGQQRAARRSCTARTAMSGVVSGPANRKKVSGADTAPTSAARRRRSAPRRRPAL